MTSTASLLPGIRALFLKSKAGRSTWRQFVLDEVSSYIYSLLTFSCELPSSLGYRSTLQAQVYVNDENLPCGYAPKGGFHSSKEIDESFFDPISDEGHHVGVYVTRSLCNCFIFPYVFLLCACFSVLTLTNYV